MQLQTETIQQLQKDLERSYEAQIQFIKTEFLKHQKTSSSGLNYIVQRLDFNSPEALKNMLFQLRSSFSNFICVTAGLICNKPSISIIVSEDLQTQKEFHAGQWIKDLAQHIKGGGGGQAFYAQAGGTDPKGLETVLNEALKRIL